MAVAMVVTVQRGGGLRGGGGESGVGGGGVKVSVLDNRMVFVMVVALEGRPLVSVTVECTYVEVYRNVIMPPPPQHYTHQPVGGLGLPFGKGNTQETTWQQWHLLRFFGTSQLVQSGVCCPTAQVKEGSLLAAKQ